jgi:hypothetical protein
VSNTVVNSSDTVVYKTDNTPIPHKTFTSDSHEARAFSITNDL